MAGEGQLVDDFLTEEEIALLPTDAQEKIYKLRTDLEMVRNKCADLEKEGPADAVPNPPAEGQGTEGDGVETVVPPPIATATPPTGAENNEMMKLMMAMRGEMQEMQRKMTEGGGGTSSFATTESRFVDEIANAPIPRYEKRELKSYNGLTDPDEFMKYLEDSRITMDATKTRMCQIFPSLLEGDAPSVFFEPQRRYPSWKKRSQPLRRCDCREDELEVADALLALSRVSPLVNRIKRSIIQNRTKVRDLFARISIQKRGRKPRIKRIFSTVEDHFSKEPPVLCQYGVHQENIKKGISGKELVLHALERPPIIHTYVRRKKQNTAHADVSATTNPPLSQVDESPKRIDGAITPIIETPDKAIPLEAPISELTPQGNNQVININAPIKIVLPTGGLQQLLRQNDKRRPHARILSAAVNRFLRAHSSCDSRMTKILTK